ncbi:hypothetical protein A3D00_03875 [Candidatus Woesebacteria bacterium RIFCSPHIGHO2_02_FULL_38_9]|uniref:Methyltransferase type 11 domain-containing protein n=1 Tax=Candidatus Woesebacteria bacterium RIFCSPHIGHO2_01_FULL_39_28 TaxID=1802496 RepID=A0A1F7YCN3_9BACT|nr:MAG: hypothetical protein A2627_00310 [Candidatus Woesebacteria bacterium RIFCSPHIGHO2_01_FULL_39_28]OGM31804.1 MAG: hypothetical protein A3D00_03875 [Candidatus Woesebacteria bacterium RIFCSPHIGHO2_02_FULL_38_9]OGM56824.1 MAG: hypothetical protein A3A50_03845 [Candidatus Woesebacteria bacterium RIFCSPLOWO2_01_FULL_38_20]
MRNYLNQQELGLAGLALLRNRLVGHEKVTKSILYEIRNLSKPFINTSLSKNKVKKYSLDSGYTAWAETYDTIPNLLIEVEEPVVKELLREFAKGFVLDAACGTGRYSEFLYSLGHKVTGLDQSSAMLRQAKIRSPKVKFIKGILTKLPFDDSCFDLAVCALALTHVSDIGLSIKELFRVIRPGGNIIISDVHPWLVVLGAQAEFHDKTGRHAYVTNYIHWHSTYLQTFERLGLKVLQCIEPVMEHKHVAIARLGFNLSAKTVATALQGLPIALIWVLEKPLL